MSHDAEEIEALLNKNLEKQRADALGFVFGNVPVNLRHARLNRLSFDEQLDLLDSARAATLSQCEAGPADDGSVSDDADTDHKWLLLRGRHGNHEAIRVIEDTGTRSNWISRAQVQKLGLRLRRGPTVVHRLITGHTFQSSEYIEVSWCGKDGKEGVGQFLAAPPEAPKWLEVIAGKSFLDENADVLWEQKPSEEKMLLGVLVKPKKDEKERAPAREAAAKKKSEAIDKMRRQKMQNAAMQGSFPPSRQTSMSYSSSDSWPREKTG